MKPILTAIAFGWAMAFWTACAEDRSEVKTLEKDTMDIHDEAMKLMGPMNATARSLRTTLKTTDSLSQTYKDIQTALMAIEHAESDMMGWMQGYKAPSDETPKAEALSYLKAAQEKIGKNLKDIQAATEQGKALLK